MYSVRQNYLLVFPNAVFSSDFFKKRVEVSVPQLISRTMVSSTCVVLCTLSIVLPVTQHTVTPDEITDSVSWLSDSVTQI